MAIVTTDSVHYQNIANRIRSFTGSEETYTPAQMPSGIALVYEDGYEQGHEDGRKTEYDTFWDAYQNYGSRKSYMGAFSGVGWTEATFKPKYNIVVDGTARNMFAGALSGVDIEALLSNLGVVLDTSGVTSSDGFDYFCQYASPSVLPVIDTTGVTQIRYLAYHASSLVTVRKLVLKSDGSQTFNQIFANCTKLENIVIEGTIGKNGFSVSSSPLTFQSISSIVNALADKTGDTSGTTWKITLGVTNIATYENGGGSLSDITNKGWNVE